MNNIEKAQKKAKEIGHCLCNIKLDCPCEDFLNTNICKCADVLYE